MATQNSGTKKGKMTVKTTQTYTAIFNDTNRNQVECVDLEAYSVEEAKQFVVNALVQNKINANQFIGIVEGGYVTNPATNTIMKSDSSANLMSRSDYYNHLVETFGFKE